MKKGNLKYTMSRRGVSLIELLIVIAIIVLLSLATIPSIALIHSGRLNSSGNTFANTLTLARTIATGQLNLAMVAIRDDGRYNLFTLKKNRELPPEQLTSLSPGSEDDFYVDSNNNGSRVWVERGRWEKLNDGVVWSDIETQSEITNRPIYNAPLPPNTSNYVIFETDGSIPIKKKFRLFSLSNTNNTYDVYVVKETGSIKVDRK